MAERVSPGSTVTLSTGAWTLGGLVLARTTTLTRRGAGLLSCTETGRGSFVDAEAAWAAIGKVPTTAQPMHISLVRRFMGLLRSCPYGAVLVVLRSGNRSVDTETRTLVSVQGHPFCESSPSAFASLQGVFKSP